MTYSANTGMHAYTYSESGVLSYRYTHAAIPIYGGGR